MRYTKARKLLTDVLTKSSSCAKANFAVGLPITLFLACFKVAILNVWIVIAWRCSVYVNERIHTVALARPVPFAEIVRTFSLHTLPEFLQRFILYRLLVASSSTESTSISTELLSTSYYPTHRGGYRFPRHAVR